MDQYDAHLLLRIRERDTDAMAEIYDRHAPIVYSLALCVLKDATRAEVLSAEILLDLWRDPSAALKAVELEAYLRTHTLARAFQIRRRLDKAKP
jgi:RNA polymerase sigma-70 factor (ECF subfamily)